MQRSYPVFSLVIFDNILRWTFFFGLTLTPRWRLRQSRYFMRYYLFTGWRLQWLFCTGFDFILWFCFFCRFTKFPFALLILFLRPLRICDHFALLLDWICLARAFSTYEFMIFGAFKLIMKWGTYRMQSISWSNWALLMLANFFLFFFLSVQTADL